jgi:molecular chaperone HtpG
MAEERFGFQAEVSRLLDIVARSLYSHKDVFLRELISNASDACDRLRYAALTEADLAVGDAEYRIELSLDAAARTLSVADNGIGMNRAELIENLGTIARSGTAAFLGRLTGDVAKDLSLIGQFGVGFYSAFMVADRVEVVTRRAGEPAAWRWVSDGKGEFTVFDAERDSRGTTVTAHLRAGEEEFLDPERLRAVVKRYSDHIAFPVVLKGEGGAKDEVLNSASALWARPKVEITADQYREFYHHAAHAFDDPWLVLHNRGEGVVEYTSLLFVPTEKPLDLFDPERKTRIKLYVRRVFVTDDCDSLMPAYLRFVRGIVDSQDLPLNISREMLQHNPVLAKIRASLTGRILGELAKKAEADAESYARFWRNFGAVLKEGLIEDAANRERILELCRFRSSRREGLIGLAQYVEALPEGQDSIFFITGEDIDLLCRSPQLEGFRARGVEVLLLDDPVDDFWISAVGSYGDKPFRSTTKGGVDIEKIRAAAGTVAEKVSKPEAEPAELGALIAAFKQALQDKVKDVRVSQRLTESPVCLVADERDLDLHVARVLKQHRQIATEAPRILEINPRHEMIVTLARLARGAPRRPEIEDAAFLLWDQARILEGEPPADPDAFSARLARVLARGLSPAGEPPRSC